MRSPGKRYAKGIKWPGPQVADKYAYDISPYEFWRMEENRRKKEKDFEMMLVEQEVEEQNGV